MSGDIRAALERLVHAYDNNEGLPIAEWIAAARAALASAPEGEPSDEELIRTYANAVAAAVDAHPGAFNQEDVQAAQLAGLRAALSRWGRPAAPPAPLVDLPPDYIDEWITNPRDRSLLEVFHKACNSEGGSADEVILRGLKAVLHDDLSRSHRLQQENHRFREPERTILCDILANGTLLPDLDGTRYGIPATPPAPLEGEVGEFIAQLKSYAEYGAPIRLIPFVVDRAATLLEQLSAAHPEEAW